MDDQRANREGGAMIQRFNYEFDDDPTHGMMAYYNDPPDDARLIFQVENGNEIWVSGNRGGWEHLAKICAEMALRSEWEPGDHVHRSYDLKECPPDRLQVSFEFS
jgi:hypothetical protein